MEKKIEEKFKRWVSLADDELVKELKIIEHDESELEDRFYKNLSFGTAGMRGILGAGTNRINKFVVGRMTQAICDYLKQIKKKPSVAISYDSRAKSDAFSKHTASVFAANGIDVHIFEKLTPVPMLSFAVRELKCEAGIMITASHNPAEYNGYKVYGADGCQIGEDVAQKMYSISQDLDFFNDVKTLDFDVALKEGKIKYVEKKVIEKYYEAVFSCLINKNLLSCKNFRVLYTPLNGAGNLPVREVLNRLNVNEVFVVKEQEQPDENFTTCSPPNPETKEALSLGLKYCKEKKPDVLIATDPDCDRVGIAVPSNKNKESYVILNGNEIGILMFYYICVQRSSLNTLPKNPVAVKTIVSSSLVEEIAKDYCVCFKNVLTGFKYIGEQIALLEAKNEQERFVFGFEESHGYLAGGYVRDKDGVFAASFLCEIVAFYKKQNMLISDVLNNIYEKYGYCKNRVESFVFDGKQGMQKMQDIITDLRQRNILKIGNFKIRKRLDYLEGIEIDFKTKEEKAINLNRSNVLQYVFENKASLIVRPSGTEPKIKIYYSVLAATQKKAEELEKDLIKSFGFKDSYV